MADQSIFGNQNNTETPPNNTPAGGNQAGAPNNQDTIATLLSEIKNERGEPKYANIEAALEGLRNAQEFIPTLRGQLTAKEQEVERLREQAERAVELERTLEALTSQQQQGNATHAPALDETKIAELVNRTLTAREKHQIAQSNLQSVVATLQQSYGADAETKFYGKAEEMGMTKEEMNALAARSPKAVLTMLGVNQQSANKQNTQITTPSSVNSAGYTPNQETFIGRNNIPTIVGATSADLKAATERAKKMVEELHAQGKSVHDFTDPKVYMKYFS